MFAKPNAEKLKRKMSEGHIHIASTVAVFVVVALIVIVLITFIADHYKTIVIPKDMYFPQFTTITQTHSSSVYLCHKSSYSNQSQAHILNATDPQFTDSNGIVDMWHSMSDDELMEKAALVSRDAKYSRKVAFMFLTPGRLSLSPLWEEFFRGNEGLFSIYLHTSPDFNFEPLNSSVFYKRRIPSKLVQWGKPTMIDAERRLLANALLDTSNQRFVLLSETCIPLFNFTTIYNYLMNSTKSFLGSFDDPRKVGRGRYNKLMGPTITLQDWRKGSQWFEVNRQTAYEMISDKIYYHVFQNHCSPPCYMDEHYFPTLINKVRPSLTTNRTVTWTDWSVSGPHPKMFMKKDITEKFLNQVRYESKCTYNGGNSSICFLFARKFHPNTLEPLMNMAPKMLGFSS